MGACVARSHYLPKKFTDKMLDFSIRCNQIQRIHPDPALHHLKMQMVAGAVARAAYIPDHLTSRHGFTRRDGSFC